MKKSVIKTLVSVLIGTTAVTAGAAITLSATSNIACTVAEMTNTTRFEMVDGASIRYGEPLGLRFIAELGQQEYSELKSSEDGVTKRMGMFIMPWSYIANENDVITTTDYASVATKLDYVFYSSDGKDNEGNAITEKLYEHKEEDGDTYYRANGVISNLNLHNYATEFVGIGYIAETKNGTTTYTYTDICKEDNVRTSAYVAIEAYADKEYVENTKALSVFTKYIDGAQLYNNWNVTEEIDETTEVRSYTYNGVSYTSLEEVKTAISDYSYSLTLDKSLKYVKEKGTAQLNATIKNTTHTVDFKGAHAVYTSSDESVVKVDKTGKLSWVKNGMATITAEFADIKTSCEVISGVIDFDNMTAVPAYLLSGGRSTLSIAEDNGGKVLQVTATDTDNNARTQMSLECLDALFENEDVQYMAFDMKLHENARTATNNILYHNGSGWTAYNGGASNQFTVPTVAAETYFFPRSVYQTWSTAGASNPFINIGSGLATDESYWIDNIRSVTAEEYLQDFMSFEHGALRTSVTNEIRFYLSSEGTQQLSITNVDNATAKRISSNVTDGKYAVQFTRNSTDKTKATEFQFNSTADTLMEKAMRGGYIAFDLYVPEESDAVIRGRGQNWYGVLKKGWNTIYEWADSKENWLFGFTDTTESTYVIDNFRLVTEEEYNQTTKFGFESGGVLRYVSDTQTFYYAGYDKVNYAASVQFNGTHSNVHFDSDIKHSGNYSLAFEKKEGYLRLTSVTSAKMYEKLKGGFTFWIYSTTEIDGKNTANFVNNASGKLQGGAGIVIPANTWTQVLVTAADITTDGHFLVLQNNWAATIYLDDFKPLTNKKHIITFDVGEGTLGETTQEVMFGSSYELPTPTSDYEFSGWYNGDELVPSSGIWLIEGDVTLTARYSLPYYNAEVGEKDSDGVINGITLNASRYTGARVNDQNNRLPTATEDAADTVDMSYYSLEGDYGLNDFLTFDFTGNNMPILSFFDTTVTNTVYNHAQSTDVKGWIVANGMSMADGVILGNAASKRLNLVGPNKITYQFDGSNNDTSLAQNRIAIATDSPITMLNLNGSTDEYRMIVGWVENSTNSAKMDMRMIVWNLTTEERIVDITEGEATKANWTGDIALYGHFGRETKIDKLYPVVNGLDAALAAYAPVLATEIYNATWDGDDLILAPSTNKGGDQAAPPSANMSFIAFNGDYGMNDFVVFDFTGDNMPFVSFFNNRVTNTVFNPKCDTNVKGWVFANGLYKNDGTTYGGVHDQRLAIIGPNKIVKYDSTPDGTFRSVSGNPNPISIDSLQSVTDTYRAIIGCTESNKQYIQIAVINMVTGDEVVNTQIEVGAGKEYSEGSIALHGQFGKTTVLDKVIGVVEDTTLEDLITEYSVKDSDYSDEQAVTLDRYAYASLSDGQWTIDGNNQVSNPTDYRTQQSAYTTYKDAGFNIVLAQDMINPDVDKDVWEKNGKIYMDNAHTAGLKVILTDWHIQILSKPVKVNKDGTATNEHDTYLPWIIGEDLNETTGLAAQWKSIVSGMGITIDSTRFATRAALDSYIATQLAQYKNHPAFYGVMLGDEPSYHNAYCYSEIYKSIKRVMPECYVQYNLLPMEEDAKNIKFRYTGQDQSNASSTEIVAAYKQYVELFLDSMGTDYIQYDDYPFKSATYDYWFWTESEPHIDTPALRTIQLMAELAKERNLSLKVVTQTCLMKKGSANGDVCIRQITEDDARWLNNYLLGFGVDQINYFTYWTKRANRSTDEYFDDGGSFVNRDGTTTAVYDFMKTIMENNTTFAPTISNFDYNASKVVSSSYQFSKEHITWATMTANSFKFVTNVTTSTDATLVTELYDKDNYNYMYMVMNTIDPNEKNANGKDTTQTITVTFDGTFDTIYVYNQKGERTSVTLTNNTYTVTLTAGQAVYLLPY